MLVGFCLFSYFTFYFGGLIEEQKTIKILNADLIKTKGDLKNELERTRNECNINREKDMATCQDMMKQQKEAFDDLINMNKEEAKQNEIAKKQEKDEKYQDAKELYQDWASKQDKHFGNCESSLTACQGKIDQQRQKETAKVGELTSEVTQCRAEMSFKASKLESCETRLNNSITIMKGKGIEVI